MLRLVALLVFMLPLHLQAQGLVDVVRKVKQSIVGIILVQKDPRTLPALIGTGFSVADGRHIITNYHVVRDKDLSGGGQLLYGLVQNGANTDRRELKLIAVAPGVDLALLEISGAALPAMKPRDDADLAPEGTDIAITGFPIGAVLGFTPTTSRGIVSAHTPNRSPEFHSQSLDADIIRAPRYQTYQLDVVAFPGNSGGPLYDAQTGTLLGVVASTFIKSTKEKVLSDPSAITYAIPSGFVRQILIENNIKP